MEEGGRYYIILTKFLLTNSYGKIGWKDRLSHIIIFADPSLKFIASVRIKNTGFYGQNCIYAIIC